MAWHHKTSISGNVVGHGVVVGDLLSSVPSTALERSETILG